MGDALAEACSLLAFVVTLSLAVWCLGNARRSLPTFLHALILSSFAFWTGFEFLWFRHHLPTYEHLSFAGTTLAVTFGFHYAASLSPPGRSVRIALTAVYGGASFFLLSNLGGWISRPLEEVFWTPGYNLAFICFVVPVGAASMGLLAQGRSRARDSNLRSLYTYPLAAGLVALPLGITELSRPLGLAVPRLGSLGALAAGIILSIGVLRHRRIYDALAVLRRDAAAVLRATVQGILVVESDGRVVFSNGVARGLLGSHPQRLEEAGLEWPVQPRSLVRRGDRILEVRAIRSGEVIPSGRVSLILQDKTRDLELMRALASKEALASLGEAAATLVHQARNPLTAMRAALDCISQDLAGGRAPERRHVEIVNLEVRRLGGLLDRSLELSRPLELRPESCDVNDLLRASLAQVPAPAGVDIRTEFAAGLPRINGDPELLIQLFVNILRNGVEASRRVEVLTGRDDDWVRVVVRSAGARIPEQVLSRLFEPFVTSKPGGTGLGLALARKIATAHQARLEGRNTQTGVDFEIRLPA